MKGNSMVFTMVLPPILGGVLMLHQTNSGNLTNQVVIFICKPRKNGKRG